MSHFWIILDYNYWCINVSIIITFMLQLVKVELIFATF